MTNERNEIISMVLFAVIVLAACVGWWKSYVQPNDAHIWAVHDCVGSPPYEEERKQAWRECHNELVGEAGGLVQYFHPPIR